MNGICINPFYWDVYFSCCLWSDWPWRMMDTRNILWTVSFSPLEQTSCTVRNMSLAVIDVSYQNELDDPLVSPTVEPFGTIDDSLFGHSVCSVFCLKNEDAVEGGAGVFIV